MPYLPVVIPGENSSPMRTARAPFQSAQHPPIVPGKIFIELLGSRERPAPAGQNFLERLFKMVVVGKAGFVEIHLSEHEIARQNQAFGRVKSAFGNPESRAPAVHARNGLNRLRETVPIETAIIDPRVVRIPQEIIHPIRIYRALYELAPEQRTSGVFATLYKRNYVIGGKSVISVGGMAFDHVFEDVAHDFRRVIFVPVMRIFCIGLQRKSIFARVRKRRMARPENFSVSRASG